MPATPQFGRAPSLASRKSPDALHQTGELGDRRRLPRTEGNRALGVLDIHTVVQIEVEVQRCAEALAGDFLRGSLVRAGCFG